MAKISNLVTFAILLALITLLIYLYYLRKRRTQQTLLWLRTHDVNAQNHFGPTTVIYPYGNRGIHQQGQNYHCNNGLIFMPTTMGFNDSQLRNQNFQGTSAPWHMNGNGPGFQGDISHPNLYNTPHYIATPPSYTPAENYVMPSTLDDLPPPYSSLVTTNEESTKPESTSALSPSDESNKIVVTDTSQQHISTSTTNNNK